MRNATQPEHPARAMRSPNESISSVSFFITFLFRLTTGFIPEPLFSLKIGVAKFAIQRFR